MSMQEVSNKIVEYLNRIPFNLALTKQEKDIISASSITRSYKKGEYIHSSDNQCLGMLLVLAGEIRTYLVSEEGREVTLFRLYHDDICVLSASCVLSHITFETSMTALQDTTVMIIPTDTVIELEKNIHVRCFLYELATRRFSDVMWSMQQLLFKRMDQRLAEFLLNEHRRSNQAELSMTHEVIANHISSARETVARMLKRFSEDGLVEVKRGTIIIKDIEGLKRLL